jgi:hypothetical protein
MTAPPRKKMHPALNMVIWALALTFVIFLGTIVVAVVIGVVEGL